MVACPKCGKDNPPHYKRCFWCGEDITEAVLHWLDTLSEPIVPMEVPKRQKFSRIKTGSYATIGYLLLAISIGAFAVVPERFYWFAIIIGILGASLLSGFWIWFGKRYEEENGVFFGIFSLGLFLIDFMILTMLATPLIGIKFGELNLWLVQLGFSAYFITLFISLWLIWDFAENTRFKTIGEIVFGIALLEMVAILFLDVSGWMFLILLFFAFVFSYWIHSAVLLSASKKIESRVLKAASGIFKASVILLILSLTLILISERSGFLQSVWMGSASFQKISTSGSENLFLIIQTMILSFGCIVAGFGFLKGKEKPTYPAGPVLVPREAEGGLRNKVKIISLIVIGMALLGSLGAYFYVQRNFPWVLLPSGKIAVNVDGTIEDKIVGDGENFMNGKLRLKITLTKGTMEDVLGSTYPLQLWFMGPNGSWIGGDVSFSAWGAIEEFYGGTVELDGVIGVSEAVDNLYVHTSAPVSPTGDIIEGSVITVEMWPTKTSARGVDADISSATFDENCTDNFWNVGERLGLFLLEKNHVVTLLGKDGVLLRGDEK